MPDDYTTKPGYSLVITGVKDLSDNTMQFAVYPFRVDIETRQEAWQAEELLLYPNPHRGVFAVTFSGGRGTLSGREVSIVDLAGRRVPFRVTGNRIEMEAEPGCYVMEVKGMKGLELRTRFVVY